MAEFLQFPLRLEIDQHTLMPIGMGITPIRPVVMLGDRSFRARLHVDDDRAKQDRLEVVSSSSFRADAERVSRVGFVAAVREIEYQYHPLVVLSQWGNRTRSAEADYLKAEKHAHELRLQAADLIRNTEWINAFYETAQNGSWIVGHFQTSNGERDPENSGALLLCEQGRSVNGPAWGPEPEIYDRFTDERDLVARLDLLKGVVT